MIQLGDPSDIFDPLGDCLLESLDKGRVLESLVVFLLEVVDGHLSSLLLALFVHGLDLWIMDQLDFWNNHILLTLDEVNFQLGEVFLDVLETGGGRATLVRHRRFDCLVGVEKGQKGVFDICGCKFEDVEIFSDEAKVEKLELL